MIPFDPETNWGVESQLLPFDGHLVQFGEAPIATRLPSQLVELSLEGELVVDLDPLEDGIALGLSPLPDVQVGANGRLLLTPKFFRGIDIRLEVGDASFLGLFTDDGSSVTLSGRVGPNQLSMPTSIPIEQLTVLEVAAHLSDDPDDPSFVVLEGGFAFLGSELNLPLIPDMLDFEINVTVQVAIA